MSCRGLERFQIYSCFSLLLHLHFQFLEIWPNFIYFFAWIKLIKSVPFILADIWDLNISVWKWISSVLVTRRNSLMWWKLMEASLEILLFPHFMCFCFVLITPPLIWWFHFLQKSKKIWAHVWIFFPHSFYFIIFFSINVVCILF